MKDCNLETKGEWGRLARCLKFGDIYIAYTSGRGQPISMAKYPRVINDEGIELEPHKRHKRAFELLKFMCCDCGLVHLMSFAIEKNGNLGIAMKRLAGSTAAARRHKKGLRLPKNK